MSYTVDADGLSVESSGATSEAALRESLMIAPAAVETPEEWPDAKPAELATIRAGQPDADLEPVPGEADAASEAGKTLASRRKSIQARIDAATREKHDAKRTADAATAEATRLRAELDAYKAAQAKPVRSTESAPVPAAPATSGDPEPTPEQFDTYEKYVKHQARWEARQETQAVLASLAQQQATHAIGTAQSRVETTARAAHADFEAVVGKFATEGHRFSPFVSDVILHHPLGHEIAYALAKDVEANTRLTAAPNVTIAGIEMGRFIARLEAAVPGPAPVAPAVTTAKPPIKPVGSSPISASDEPPAGDDLDAHIAYYNQKDTKARTAARR